MIDFGGIKWAAALSTWDRQQGGQGQGFRNEPNGRGRLVGLKSAEQALCYRTCRRHATYECTWGTYSSSGDKWCSSGGLLITNKSCSVRAKCTLDAYVGCIRPTGRGGAQSAVHRSIAYLALCKGKSKFVVQSAGHFLHGASVVCLGQPSWLHSCF
jgi:hypothetical protein